MPVMCKNSLFSHNNNNTNVLHSVQRYLGSDRRAEKVCNLVDQLLLRRIAFLSCGPVRS